jgi:chaperonin cofactor prefoldin
MSLEDGIGQIRGFGEMAVREIIGRADFQTFARQLPGTLLSAAGGEMPRVVFDTYLGAAGGQASWGAQLLWEELLSILIANTGATIDSFVHVVGGISFTGPAFPRTQANASASIAQWLHRNNHLPGDRVNLTLHLSEISPVGTNKPLRTQLLLDHYSALQAPAVEKNIKGMRSNRAAAGEYGNVLLTRSDRFQGLSKPQIVGEVASAYLPKLAAALKVTADPGQFKGLSFEYQHSSDHRLSVKQALAQAMRARDVEQLVDLVLAPRHTRAEPLLAIHGGGTIDLQRVREHFAKPVASLKEVRQRISMLKGAIKVVASEITDLRRQFERIEAHLEEDIEEIEASFAQLLGRRNSKQVTALLEKLIGARQINETIEEMHSELSVLRKAEEDFRTELSELLARLGRLYRGVKACSSQTIEREGPAWIVPIALSRRLAELLAVADTMGDDLAAMQHALSTMTGYVTLDGLTRITRAKSATVESIVSEVVSRQHTRKGPNWGGAAREDQSDAFLVYPPVEPTLQKRLVARHRQLGHDLTRISFSPGADCSVNLSILELRSCTELREILTPHYQTGLAQVLASEARPLFLSDPEILKDLGISGIDVRAQANTSPAK